MKNKKGKHMFGTNDKYKIMNELFFISIVILLPLVSLFSSINLVTYDINYYGRQFDKYNISAEVGINETDLLDATQNLLDYIKGKRNDLNFTSIIKNKETEFFSYRDKLHMVDVKNIFMWINIARYVTIALLILITFLISFNNKIKINTSKCFVLSSILGALPFVMLLLLMYLDFNKYFTIFHKIFFRNDLWLLDPNTDRLVNIFPEEFFLNMAIKILTNYFIALAIIFTIGIGMILKGRKKYI